jgi:hypothetical protein
MSVEEQVMEYEGRDRLERFALKHKLAIELEGEVGFGRECVGLTHGNNYIGYHPWVYKQNGTLHPDLVEHPDPKIMDPRLKPPKGYAPDAYHKHTCVCVLGRSPDAIAQLVAWADYYEELGVEAVDYETGATGLQAMMTGVLGKAFAVLELE